MTENTLVESFSTDNYRIKDDNILPQYIDFGGIYFDEYVLTIDHHVTYIEATGEPHIDVDINGRPAERFFNDVRYGSGRSPTYNPTVEDDQCIDS